MRDLKAPVVLFGGGGFVGRHLDTAFRQMGAKTTIVDVSGSPMSVHGDVRDYTSVLKLSEGANIIVHLAGELPPHGWSKGRKGEMWDIIVNGTENVMRAALENGVGKVIYISSSAVYGVPTSDLITEDSPKNPLDEYGKAKLRAEETCRKYIDGGLDITIVRPMTILGDGFVGILRALLEFIYLGKNIPFLGDGSNRIQMVYVDDVVNACLLVASSERSRGEVFNIGSHDPPTVHAELEELIRYANSKSEFKPFSAALVRPFLILTRMFGAAAVGKEIYSLGDKTFVLSTEKAEKALRWAPTLGNVEGLKRSYDWFVANHDEAKPKLSLALKVAMRVF
ncbi:MAG: NAD(P)-dependent oxidoreductase [Nitrososphaerales archaeon]